MAGTMKIKIAKLKNLLRLFFRFFISFRLQMKLYSLLLSRKKKEQNSALQWLKHLADPRLYRQADPDAAQLLFKKYVTIVHLEISSFCNRSCLYCPNGQLPGKRKQKNQLPEELFEKCLKELASIQYDQYIEFNGFNEPLHDRELFLRRVAAVRRFLPDCHLVINTNADYLTEEYLNKIAAAGVHTLFMTLHLLPEEFHLTQAQRLDKIQKFLNRFPALQFDQKEEEGFLLCGNTNIYFRLSNINEYGHNWAGTVKYAGLRRAMPCFVPAKQIYVDYSGRVNLCCSVNMDYPGMEDFSVGNVKESSLFDLFTCAKAAKIRKSLVDMRYQPECCKYCSAQVGYIFNAACIENPYHPYLFRGDR